MTLQVEKTSQSTSRSKSGDPGTARAFAPASVSNLACGFDVLGFAISGLGDEVEARLGERPGVEIEQITGDEGRLPLRAESNTAGVAASTLLTMADRQQGVRLSIHKRMPLASGLGSSAASAVAAVVAVDRLLGLGASPEELLAAAVAGECVASGSVHADNTAPSLYGGLVLVRSPEPPDVISLPVPEGLSCALVRPHTAVETGASRALLGDRLALSTAVHQWANLAALVAALYRGDLELLSRSLVDEFAEPVRGPSVPGFAAAKAAALEAGALGSSLSGSGPAVFALGAGAASAERVAEAMEAAVRSEGLGCDRLVSPVGVPGALAS